MPLGGGEVSKEGNAMVQGDENKDTQGRQKRGDIDWTESQGFPGEAVVEREQPKTLGEWSIRGYQHARKRSSTSRD